LRLRLLVLLNEAASWSWVRAKRVYGMARANLTITADLDSDLASVRQP
jgi:hypothetical protein